MDLGLALAGIGLVDAYRIDPYGHAAVMAAYGSKRGSTAICNGNADAVIAGDEIGWAGRAAPDVGECRETWSLAKTYYAKGSDQLVVVIVIGVILVVLGGGSCIGRSFEV